MAEKTLLGSAALEALFQGGLVFSIAGPKGDVTFTFSDGLQWRAETQGGHSAGGRWKISENAICRNEARHSAGWEGLERKKTCFTIFQEGNALFLGSRAIPMKLRDPDVVSRLDVAPETAASGSSPESERASLVRHPDTLAGGRASPVPKSANISWGRYHALVIGINDYKALPKLKTALTDARAVAKVLREDYGYTVRLMENPERDDIIDEFDRLRDTLTEDDNLLIYYGGHGWLDRQSGRGYWLPADAEEDRRSRWLSNASVTDTLQALLAKHVMVVVDSCFSGTLTRSIAVPEQNSSYLARMIEKRTRVVLSSGGLEPVVDAGGGNHSVFAAQFLKALRDNGDVLDGTQLFEHVRRSVMLNAQQTPQYSDIRFAGHEGGDFMFVRNR
ncbi:MAG: caspase family protein [Alphaproteobacteria bacterium]